MKSLLMLHREIVAVCSEIHIKHMEALCGQNVELLNVKDGGTYNYHWGFSGLKVGYKNQSVKAV